MTIMLDRVSEPAIEIKSSKWKLRWSWEKIGLGGILALSAFLGLWNLSINGYSNEFYASAVRSMLQSWHNFFYLSFDPGGFVTVDKPPLAFMVQTAFAKVFGFSGVSLLLPEALAGVGGVYLLYYMVKRAFGAGAGLLAGLMLAVTPIFVVMNRDNNPDSLLVFTLILSAWAVLRAAELGKLRWLLLAGALVGLAFNIKMLEAWIVLPAFYLMYFLFASTSWFKRVWHLALASVVIVVVSFSWAVAVDLTPANQRPYIDGSSNNTVMDLIFGYNGLGRVDGNENGGNAPGGNRDGGQLTFPGGNGQGQAGLPGNNGTTVQPNLPGDTANGQAGFPGNGNFQPPAFNGDGRQGNGGPGFGGPGGGGPGGAGFGGQPGITRLITPTMAGEFNWYFPLAILGLGYLGAYAWFGLAKGKERSRQLQAVAFWGGWFLVYGLVLSFSKGIIHNYYMTIMAPAAAALAGPAVVMLWKRYREGNWQGWLLPVGLAAAAFYQAYILTGYTSWNWWLSPALLVLGLVALAGLTIGMFVKNQPLGRRFSAGVVWVVVGGLLVTPVWWSIRSVFSVISGSIPSAVPGGSGMGGSNGQITIPQAWLNFIGNNLAGELALILVVAVLIGAGFGLRRLLKQKRWVNLPVVTGVLLTLFLVGSTGFWINAAQGLVTRPTALRLIKVAATPTTMS